MPQRNLRESYEFNAKRIRKHWYSAGLTKQDFLQGMINECYLVTLKSLSKIHEELVLTYHPKAIDMDLQFIVSKCLRMRMGEKFIVSPMWKKRTNSL